MKAVISEWLVQIVVIAILGVLVDIILPNSSFRKYTGFIFGMFILVMFLQPVLQFLDQAQSFQNLVYRNTLTTGTNVTSFQSSRLEERQRQQLEAVFRESLEKDLAYQLKREADLETVSVAITFRQERGQTDFSLIERIDVTAEPKEQVVFIEPVKIGARQNDSRQRTMAVDKIGKIKGILSDLCQLEEQKIYVNGK